MALYLFLFHFLLVLNSRRFPCLNKNLIVAVCKLLEKYQLPSFMPDQQPRQRKKAAAKKQQSQPPAEPKTRAAKAAAANATASPR
jgi:hypothetical protein